MCFTVTLTERWRRVFGLCSTVLNVVVLLLGLSLIVCGIAIRVKLDSRLELMEDYNPGALPILLMVTGALLFLTHLLAVKFCYDATYVETRSTEHHRFIALIIFMVILCLYVFIAEIVTLVHSSKIEDALERGISNMMKAYISDLESKERIDNLQLEFTCCGAYSYEDWFKIAWINLAYINTKNPDVQTFIKDGKFIKDDAPFSCCNRFSKFACIHHSVKSSTAHQAQEITLSREGCASAISNYFHERLISPTAILILFILIFQVIAITLMRLLQTSIVSAEELGDPEAEGAAYCIQTMGVGKDNRSYFKTKDKAHGESEDQSDEDGDEVEIADEEGGRKSGMKNVLGKMKSGFKKPKLPWKRKKRGDDDNDDDDDGNKGKSKKGKYDDDKGQKKDHGGKEDKKKDKQDKKDRKDQSKKDKKDRKDQSKKDKKEKKTEDKKKKKDKKERKGKEKAEKKKDKDAKKKKKKAEKKAKAQAKKEKKKAKKAAKKSKKKKK